MPMLYATGVNSLSPICLRNTIIQVKEISQLASCTRGENCSSRVGLNLTATRRDEDWKPLQICKLVRDKLCCLWIISPIPSRISRELKMETFSARRQLQPDVTSWFVQSCACSCSPHCRRSPVGDVKLVCLALWREREYLTFISIRFVAFSDKSFADYRSYIFLVFFESHFKLDFQALNTKFHVY